MTFIRRPGAKSVLSPRLSGKLTPSKGGGERWVALGRNNLFATNTVSVATTDTTGTATKVYKVKGAATKLKLLVGNQRTSTGTVGVIESDGLNAIPTNKLSIETPLGATPVAVTKGGAASFALTATDAGAETDSIVQAVADQDDIRVRAYTGVSAPDRFVFNSYLSDNRESGNFGSQAGDGTDKTGVSGTFTQSGPSTLLGKVPFLLLGVAPTAKTLLLIGDSIGAGRGWNPTTAKMPTKLNCFDLGITEGQINSINAAISGATDIVFFGGSAASDTRTRRLLARYSTHVLDENGTNDLAFATIWQEAAVNKLLMAALCGKPFYITTVTPRVVSTDNCITVANQTKTSIEARRTAYNDWVRGGCQVDGAGYPVASGGTASPLIAGYVDFAAALEVDASNVPTVNGGYMKVPAAAASGPFTLTGTPTTTAFAIGSTPWTSGAMVGQVVKMLTGARAGQVAVVAGNTTSGLTLYANGSTAQSGVAVTGLSAAPAAGDTFELWDVYSNEGLHPAVAGHAAMAVKTAAFVTSIA